MKKTFKIAVLAAGMVVIAYIYFFFFFHRQYNYRFELFSHSIPCAFLFTPAAKDSIDPVPVSGRIRGTDQIYTYVYEHKYYVMVWRIKALGGINLRDIMIDRDVNMDHVGLYPGQILDAGSLRETEVKDGPFFTRGLRVDLDEYSKVQKTFEGLTYKGFYANVGKIGLEDGKGQILAIVNYQREIMPTLFLMYEARQAFYIIIINSRKPFGLEMLRILNLK